jgi:Flp pilus assembly protein TadB
MTVLCPWGSHTSPRVKDLAAQADIACVNLPDTTKDDLRRAASIAALAAYVGITAALYQVDARMQETGRTLAARHRAIESRVLGVASYLDRLEKSANPPAPYLASQLRKEKDQATEERRETAREIDTWKEQSGTWSIKRWFVLAVATLAFLPVILWGFQSWGIWARDRRLNRSTDV